MQEIGHDAVGDSAIRTQELLADVKIRNPATIRKGFQSGIQLCNRKAEESSGKFIAWEDSQQEYATFGQLLLNFLQESADTICHLHGLVATVAEVVRTDPDMSNSPSEDSKCTVMLATKQPYIAFRSIAHVLSSAGDEVILRCPGA